MREFARVEKGIELGGVDLDRYKVDRPVGAVAEDHGAWRKAAEGIQMQLEYNRLRISNLEMLERWGNKAWIAHSYAIRACERVLATEAASLRASREEVNKKRKLDQVSCGNELRKLALELEQYQRDNVQVQFGVSEMEAEVQQLKRTCLDRGVEIKDLTGDAAEKKAAEGTKED